MKFKYLVINILLLLCFACSKDSPKETILPTEESEQEEVETPVTKSDEKEILSFNFLQSDNMNFEQDYVVSINETDKVLEVMFPHNTNLESLIPTIEISSKATISPANKEPLNLDSPIEFTVTAEDESTLIYILNTTLGESEEATILSFTFLESDNNDGSIFGQIHEDIIGQINEEENTIELAIPTGTEISELIPTIEISEFASITPESQIALNFSQPITYTVTSQSGTTREYNVVLTSGMKTNRQLLMEIDALNPNNSLGWDFSTENLGNLNYVNTNSAEDVTGLELQERGVKNFPDGMEGFTILGSLDVSNNDLETIDENIYDVKSLVRLIADENNISSISPKIKNLTKISILFLRQNQISELPEEITELASLTTLALSANLIEDLPTNIGDLSGLKTLTMQDNQLSSLPVSIGSLNELTDLNVQRNQLTSLPSSMVNLNNLTHLTIGNNNLGELTSSITSLPSLISLSINNNNITSIPSSIGQLTTLENLNLIDNNISVIPLEINSLVKLTVLNLSRNNLNTFSSEINLPQLKGLALDYNPLGSLPQNILMMTSLGALDIRNTNLTIVPTEIENLTNLEFLALSNNSISNLPAEIGNLSNLQTLLIENNPVTVIPAEICTLVDLNNIQFIKDDDDVCE